MTSYLRRWSSPAIYLAITWPYLADPTAVYVKRSLLIFFFMLCAWHTLRPFVINKGLMIICFTYVLFIYFISWVCLCSIVILFLNFWCSTTLKEILSLTFCHGWGFANELLNWYSLYYLGYLDWNSFSKKILPRKICLILSS